MSPFLWDRSAERGDEGGEEKFFKKKREKSRSDLSYASNRAAKWMHGRFGMTLAAETSPQRRAGRSFPFSSSLSLKKPSRHRAIEYVA